MNPTEIAIADLSLLVVGCAFGLWWIFSGRSRRWLNTPDLLPEWHIATRDFLAFAALVLIAYLFLPLVVALILHNNPNVGARAALLSENYAAHFAIIAPCLAFRWMPIGRHAESTLPFSRILTIACGGLLIVLPLVQGLILAWQWLLQNFGVSTPTQPVIEFLRNAGRPGELSLWIVLAAVTAPVSEELFFRAGVFRFLDRTMPTWAAALISSTMWTILHGNLLSSLPLIVLGMVLAAIYKKTGRILTPILLHALFNLHTIVVTLLGPPA